MSHFMSKDQVNGENDSYVKDMQSVCLLLLYTNFVTDKYTKHLRNEQRN